MKVPFAVLVLAVLPFASQADTLDVKTGDWELTETTAITGVPIAKEVLDKLTPAKRDEMEVAMRDRANGGAPKKSHSCLTQQDLSRSDLLDRDDAKCSSKVKSQTKRYLELEETCPAPASSKTIIRFEAGSQESYTASIDRTEGEGAIHTDIVGRWVGPTCDKGTDD